MKQVLIVNGALALPPGKMAAQVAHASVGAFLKAGPVKGQAWLDVGMPKIVLTAKNDKDLSLLLEQSKEADLPVFLVRDAGRTVVPEGTVTCLGIGPAATDEIDAITGALPLAK